MSRYLYALGRFAFRRRGRVLASWLLAMLALGGLGVTLAQPFQDEFNIPGAESMDALDRLSMNFPQVGGTSATVVIVPADGSDVEGDAYQDAVQDFRDDVEDLPFVDTASDPYDDQVEGLIADDAAAAMVQVQMPYDVDDFTDSDDADLNDAVQGLRDALPDGATADLGGDVYGIAVPTLSIVEVLGLGVAAIVLTITLGSIIAAGMPLITAVIGVAVSMSLILIATTISDVNSTTPMLAVMLGLAVGIDYALFIISRHRDQLRQGMDVEESAARAVATAGSAVIFAGLTVIIALSGLAIAQIPFLTVMGGFAAAAVGVAVLIALTLLPALLGFGGERLRPKPKKAKKSATEQAKPGHTNQQSNQADDDSEKSSAPPGGVFLTWVRLVTKVPVITVFAVVVVLGALSLPALGLTLALPSSGQNPPDQPDRIAYDRITEYFGPGYNGPLVVSADIIGSDDPVELMDDLADDIEDLPGVEAVPLATPNENAEIGIVQVVPTTAPDAPETGDLVNRLRGMEAEWLDTYDVQTAVTGTTAVQIDVTDRLSGALAPFAIFVVGLSLILLMVVFRSFVVPIKASVGFLLSVGAAVGITSLVFNQGVGRQLINLDQAGPIISFFPILLMGILFGLAMDYEVFLVSRMREEYSHGKSARDAIDHGFVGSAPVVVAAAVIMIAVFSFFVPEGEGAIKPIAFGLAVGIFVDAFIIRMIFVPAVMAMLGDKAWWLPKWLDKLLPSLDVEGERLSHLLKLRQWPDDAERWSVYSADFATGVDEQLLHAPVDLRLEPGEVLVVEGETELRTPVLLAVSGRLPVVQGEARVGGALLPDESDVVRRRTEVIDAVNQRVIAADLATARGSDSAVVIVDGADALHSQIERERLGDLITEITSSDSQRSLILGVADATLTDDLLTGGYHHLTVRPPADHATADAESQAEEPAMAGSSGDR